MKPNKLRELWASGGTVLNGWLHIPSTWSAEVMAHAGWDSLTVDLQHGLHSIETAIQMMQVISGTPAVPIARVNWHDPGAAMRLLDAGALGIICPMINTRAECEAFIGACRYPPQGYRSLGPTRANLVFGPDYAQHANREIITIPMIETKEALDQLEQIVSVEGADVILVGTGDLRLSMTGQIGFDSDDPQVDAALDQVLAMCAKYHRIAGVFTASVSYAAQMVRRGFRFVTVKTDSSLLSDYARQVVQQARQHFSEQ